MQLNIMETVENDVLEVMSQCTLHPISERMEGHALTESYGICQYELQYCWLFRQHVADMLCITHICIVCVTHVLLTNDSMFVEHVFYFIFLSAVPICMHTNMNL